MSAADGGKHIVFFSRGKGRGHAVPDAAIARELLALEPELEISFVSYSVGARTLKELGYEVADLNLPEDNPMWETVVRVGKLLDVLREQAPGAIIVAHEEFCAMPVAKALGFRTAFLTDWFLPAEHEAMKCLQYADETVFIDEPGIYDEPQYLSGKISYVGTVLRHLEVKPEDRKERRAQLGVAQGGAMILVAPGGSAIHSEARAPIFDLVLAAYELLDIPGKRLVWVAGQPDYDVVCGKCAGRSDVVVLKPHYDFTPTLLAADVAITKGNRLPLLECEALGIPSLSISYGYNPVDDYRVNRIRTNTALRARGLNAGVLAAHLRAAIQMRGALQPKAPEAIAAGRIAAAQRLHAIISGDAETRAAAAVPRG
jgi:hypothetical protein